MDAQPVEFQLAGDGSPTYRIMKMSLRDQVKLQNKLAPLMSKLMEPLMALKPEQRTLAAVMGGGLGTLISKMGPFTDALGALSGDDTDFIMDTCLGVVQRKHDTSGQWVGVWSRGAANSVFTDISLGVVDTLMVRSVKENLGNFMAGLRISPPPQTETETAPTI